MGSTDQAGELHSEIVGPTKRLVDNLVASARTVQITSGSVATHAIDCLGSTLPPHSPRASVSTLTPRTLKLREAGGAVDGEGEPAVINGVVALEDADTGDRRDPSVCSSSTQQSGTKTANLLLQKVRPQGPGPVKRVCRSPTPVSIPAVPECRLMVEPREHARRGLGSSSDRLTSVRLDRLDKWQHGHNPSGALGYLEDGCSVLGRHPACTARHRQ